MFHRIVLSSMAPQVTRLLQQIVHDHTFQGTILNCPAAHPLLQQMVVRPPGPAPHHQCTPYTHQWRRCLDFNHYSYTHPFGLVFIPATTFVTSSFAWLATRPPGQSSLRRLWPCCLSLLPRSLESLGGRRIGFVAFSVRQHSALRRKVPTPGRWRFFNLCEKVSCANSETWTRPSFVAFCWPESNGSAIGQAPLLPDGEVFWAWESNATTSECHKT